MKVLISLSQWYSYNKATSFAKGTFCFNMSFVRFNHGFYIAQAQAKALYIMYITGMGSIKFFKNMV